MLNGENDPLTPVQQSFLLEQRLTEVDHPDHTLITYSGLGHMFAISPQWSAGLGPVEQNVLSDLHSWLSDRTHGMPQVLSDNVLKQAQTNTVFYR
jgi:uncharacterized protein